ncbi:MAG TPA: hypothetical protein VFM63_09690, partial [Pyrinomonadaceae bacterium]|nr:hypothetical protein [Pyrinomonadaceae bacterium]
STAIQNSTTGAVSGTWRVSGLPAGEYLVTLAASALTANTEDSSVDFSRSLQKRITVKLGDEKVTTLDTTLSRGAEVSGRVTLNGRAPAREWNLSPSVRPVEDLVASNSTTDQADKPSYEFGLVNPSGKFSIAPLLAGTYWFSLSLPARDEFYVKSVTRKGVDLMQAPFKLTDDQIFDDVVVTLATDLAGVKGQLSLPEAAAERLAAGDVTVIVAPADEATNRFNPGTRTLPAGAKGQIDFRSPPGEYLIAALTTAEYKTIESQISNEYFEKNVDKFLRIRLRAGEKVKDLRVPMMKK